MLLAAGRPLPRSLVQEAARTGPSTVDDVVWAGFGTLDEAAVLHVSEEALAHVAEQADASAGAADRSLRFVLAVRKHVQEAPPDQVEPEGVAELACELAERHSQAALVVSLCHRMAERLRRRGAVESAFRWIERGELRFAEPESGAEPLRGLLDLDRGALSLQAGDARGALLALDRAQAALQTAEQAAAPGATAALARARMMRGQALLLGGDLGAAGSELLAAEQAATPSDAGSEPAAEAGSPGDDRGGRAARAVAALSLAAALLGRGEVSAAVQRLRTAREDWEEAMGEEDADGAAFSLALAQALRAAGRSTELEEPLERARVLAGGDMDRLPRALLPMVLHDLGVAHADRGEMAAAATLLDEAAMMAMSLLPSTHPGRARIAYTRGLLYLAEGKQDRAQAQFERAMDPRMGAPPPEHPDVAMVKAAQAWARSREGAHRYVEAEAMLREAEGVLVTARGEGCIPAAHLRTLRKSLSLHSDPTTAGPRRAL
jgi:tetratricopeptide (TPR) repeat protein